MLPWTTVDAICRAVSLNCTRGQVSPLNRSAGSTLRAPQPLYGLEEQRKRLDYLLGSSLGAQENVTVMVQGPHGSGKTSLVRQTLSQLQLEHKFQVVWLDGTCFGDDLSALKEIALQLHLYEAIQELEKEAVEEAVIHSRAERNRKRMTSFQQCLVHLQSALQKRKIEGSTIVFVLDSFEDFAKRSRQTLLYNLFDLLHFGQVRISAVCITSDLNAFNSLEKRVQSRATHRLVQVWHVHDADTALAMLKQRATVLDTESSNENESSGEVSIEGENETNSDNQTEGGEVSGSGETTADASADNSSTQEHKQALNSEVLRSYLASVDEVFASEKVKEKVQELLDFGTTLEELQHALRNAVSLLASQRSTLPSAEAGETASTAQIAAVCRLTEDVLLREFDAISDGSEDDDAFTRVAVEELRTLELALLLALAHLHLRGLPSPSVQQILHALKLQETRLNSISTLRFADEVLQEVLSFLAEAGVVRVARSTDSNFELTELQLRAEPSAFVDDVLHMQREVPVAVRDWARAVRTNADGLQNK